MSTASLKLKPVARPRRRRQSDYPGTFRVNAPNATRHVLLSDTLDLDTVSLREARELPGWATIAALNGDVLVASEGDPA